MSEAEALAAAMNLSKRTRTGSERRLGALECRLREVREALLLPIWAVAKATGVDGSTISRVERGSDPVLSAAMRLAKFYGKSIEELWTIATETTSDASERHD